MARWWALRGTVGPFGAPTVEVGVPTHVGPLSPDEVQAQLARINASAGLACPERSRQFLRYIVEETLAGRGERIKGYNIAVEVFGRDAATFDANSDPVVRMEAGRLRRALERYYLVAGQADPILIDIPKGGYLPVFARRQLTSPNAGLETEEPVPGPGASSPNSHGWWRTTSLLPATGAAVATFLALAIAYRALAPAPTLLLPKAAAAVGPEGPTLVIVPFEVLGDGAADRIYANGLTEELLTQLAPFKELTVFGRETSRSLPPGTDAARLRTLGARYALEGGVRAASDQLRVTVRLLDTTSSAVLWSRAYSEDLRVRNLFLIQEDIARQVATAVAQPYGIVFQADARRTASEPPDDLDTYGCTLRFYAYRAELSAQGHAAVRDCLERAVARFPGYTTAWAMLSFLYLDERRFGFNPQRGLPPVERALVAARRAVALDPENGRALEGLMLALFFDQQVAEALRVGERALALNPSDTELLAEFGTRIAFSGEWARGGALIEQALAANPGQSSFYRATLALVAYMQRDYTGALSQIRQANLEKWPLYYAVAAAIYARLQMPAEAAQAGARLAAMNPAFLPNIVTELNLRNVRPEDQVHMIEGLRKAGLPIPPNAGLLPGQSASAGG